MCECECCFFIPVGSPVAFGGQSLSQVRNLGSMKILEFDDLSNPAIQNEVKLVWTTRLALHVIQASKAKPSQAKQSQAKASQASKASKQASKARPGQARQGKARQGKARQASQGKARQGKARQGKARQQASKQASTATQFEVNTKISLISCRVDCIYVTLGSVCSVYTIL